MLITKRAESEVYLPNFSINEFNCPCCGKNEMRERFLHMLQAARTMSNTPFVINSGYRCKNRNIEVGGKPSSAHLTGEASDIRCIDSRSRLKIISAAISAGFRRIGVGGDFIHLDSSTHNPQDVLWVY